MEMIQIYFVELKMKKKARLTLLLMVGTILSSACTSGQTSSTPETNLPNPASVYCEQNGGTLEFRQDSAGGVAGICVFPDGSECDEWLYFRGECKPADPTPAFPPISIPLDYPTPFPIEPGDYQGWWTYTDDTYGFSIQLPFDWIVDETTAGDLLMNGHTLLMNPQQAVASDVQVRMTFRRSGEEVLLWPTGVGSGEFIPQGTLDVNGQPVRRILFVCSTGQVNAIWYHGQAEDMLNIQVGGMEFGFILSYKSTYCQEETSLTGKVQRVGEMVIASLRVP
jgi:putative hemolysin